MIYNQIIVHNLFTSDLPITEVWQGRQRGGGDVRGGGRTMGYGRMWNMDEPDEPQKMLAMNGDS